jgi:phospholipase C
MAGTSFGKVVNELATTPGKSIFSLLTDHQITWKVYQSDLAAGNLLTEFAAVSVGKVVPIDQFAQDAASGMLPQVAFIDPQLLVGKATQTSEHPPADVQIGQKFVYDQVKALLASPAWRTSAMFITYDENGGLYDHVAPPTACAPNDTPPSMGADLGGFDHYGFRVPVYVLSPFAKKHFVSHVVHSHTSILRFIEAKFDLPALTNRDANSDAMLDMFDFDNPPFVTAPTFAEPVVDAAKLAACTTKYGE